ncbi:MAG: putative sulfate exporter family transporter, partial [Bacteroidota bacterium]
IPFPYDWSTSLVRLAKTGFVVTLFLIGTGISKEAIKHVGVRPLLQAVILWLIVLSASLFVLIKLS